VVATRMDVRWCGDSMHRSCPARHLAKQVAGGVLAGLGPGQAQWGQRVAAAQEGRRWEAGPA
jgi:hypothetical protein